MAKRRQYIYKDITMVAGIVNEAPQVKTSKNGNNYASFAIGERYGKQEDGYKYKNYRCCAFGDVGNEILAHVAKDDNVIVIGHISALSYKTADGQSHAGLWINVLRFEQNPTRKMWEKKEKELEQGPEGAEEDESEETTNAETLWGIDF